MTGRGVQVLSLVENDGFFEDAGRTLRLAQADAQQVGRQGAFVNATNAAGGS